ncbi:MAG TPA: hypothetical protein VNM14_24070 [Planctomycetota bacterium]|jgi:hypothetical protein|nr:hypothetical protein [Planctomycetota bacterium]
MSKTFGSRVVAALAVLLAVTASRHNFPLRQPPLIAPQGTSHQVVQSSAPAKKYEGVVPSRRHVENRRAEWVKTLGLAAGLHPVLRSALDHQDDLLRNNGDRLDRSTDRSAVLTAPGYLLAFLPSHPSRALPPPA